MKLEWRTVQFFLDEDLVCEVEIDSIERKKVRCTCPAFQRDAKCKHSRHVKREMDQRADGNYPIQITMPPNPEEIDLQSATAEEFRNFIIKYAKPEVI